MNAPEDLRDAARQLVGGHFVTGHAATVVRRHRRELAELLREEFGWQLTAEDHGPVRALCLPGAGHVPRGLRTRSGRPFDSLRYALVFLVAASLEAAGARTTLTVLFEEVHSRAAGIDDVDFDRNQAGHRRAFVHAVQAAVDLGILELADGNEEAFASSGQGDALYRVERAHLTRLLATSKPPSLAAHPSAAVQEAQTDTEEGQRRRRRHRLTRALVAEPVLYRDDLADDEISYLTSQEHRLRRMLDERFGLTLETRAEGWVAVDETATLTDQKFPSISVGRAAALAIVDASRHRRRADGCAIWERPELESFVSSLGAQFGTSWPIAADDMDGAARVADDATEVLAAMRLARPATAADDVRATDAATTHDDDTTPADDADVPEHQSDRNEPGVPARSGLADAICVLPAAGRFALGTAPSGSGADDTPLNFEFPENLT